MTTTLNCCFTNSNIAWFIFWLKNLCVVGYLCWWGLFSEDGGSKFHVKTKQKSNTADAGVQTVVTNV